jgi:hypothetical protein
VRCQLAAPSRCGLHRTAAQSPRLTPTATCECGTPTTRSRSAQHSEGPTDAPELAFSLDGTRPATAGRESLLFWDLTGFQSTRARARGTARRRGGAGVQPPRTVTPVRRLRRRDDPTLGSRDAPPLGEPLRSPEGEVDQLAFSTDARGRLTEARGTLRWWRPILWERDAHALRAAICVAVQRDLTAAKCTECLSDEPRNPTCSG